MPPKEMFIAFRLCGHKIFLFLIETYHAVLDRKKACFIPVIDTLFELAQDIKKLFVVPVGLPILSQPVFWVRQQPSAGDQSHPSQGLGTFIALFLYSGLGWPRDSLSFWSEVHKPLSHPLREGSYGL